MAVPSSDAFFVMTLEREGTETFGEGHVPAFQFFGGVPRRISDDNTRIAVAPIMGTGRDRKRTTGFWQLQSHFAWSPSTFVGSGGPRRRAGCRSCG